MSSMHVVSSQTMIAPEPSMDPASARSEEHTSELQSQPNLVCRLLLEKKKNNHNALLRTCHTKLMSVQSLVSPLSPTGSTLLLYESDELHDVSTCDKKLVQHVSSMSE